jgi:hypothetical protein
MEYRAIPESDVMWTTTICWSEKDKVAYLGGNRGSIYKLADETLKKLTKFNPEDGGPITRFRSVEGQVIVQQPVHPFCFLKDGMLEPMQGSVFSNIWDGRVAVWNPESRKIEVRTLDGKVERSEEKEERPFSLALVDGEIMVGDPKKYELLEVTSAGVVSTVWDYPESDFDNKTIKIMNTEKVFRGVAGDYIVLEDGLYDKDWSCLVEFEKPPVAWAATGSRVAWAFVSETEVQWGQQLVKAHTITVRDLESEEEQSVSISNSISMGMTAMDFCDDRLLAGGCSLGWVTWKAAD